MKNIVLSSIIATTLLTGCSQKEEIVKSFSQEKIEQSKKNELYSFYNANKELVDKENGKNKTEKVITYYDNLEAAFKKFDKKIILKKDKYTEEFVYELGIENKFFNIEEFITYINKNTELNVKKINDKEYEIEYKNKLIKKLKDLKIQTANTIVPVKELEMLFGEIGGELEIDERAKEELSFGYYIDISGSGYDFLSKITNDLNLFLEIKENKVKISKYKEKIFKITPLALTTSSSSDSKTESGETKIGDIASATSIKTTSDLYKDLEESVKSLLAMEKNGSSFFLSKSTSQLSLTGTKKDIEKASRLIKEFNEIYSKNIIIEIQVAEVLLEDKFSNGIDFNSLQQMGERTIDFTSNLGTAGTISTLANNSIKFDSKNFSSVLKMINTFGESRIVNKPKTSTLNTIETTLFLGKSIEYFSNVTTTNNVSLNGIATPSYSTESKTVNHGISLAIKPKVVNNSIQMVLQAKISSLQGFDENTIGTITTKSAIINKRDFLHVLNIKAGETWMLAGMKEHFNKNTKSGMPFIDRQDNWYDFAGGIKNRESYDLELLFFVTAYATEEDE